MSRGMHPRTIARPLSSAVDDATITKKSDMMKMISIQEGLPSFCPHATRDSSARLEAAWVQDAPTSFTAMAVGFQRRHDWPRSRCGHGLEDRATPAQSQ
eukprot:5746545-Amphidinium_carterae.1